MDAVDIATIAGTVLTGAGLIYAALTYHKRHERPGPRPFRPATWRLRRPTHPPVANPRPQPTARFTGRTELLADLARALSRNRLVVVHGLGGVGKTQLVLRYLEQHARDYQVVWWIRADQPTTLAADLARLAAALHLPEQADPDQEVVIEALRGWLQRHPGWLLVFDNAEDEPTLARFLPALGDDRRAGRVLVTTRYDLWRDAATVPVRPWSRAEAVAFLRRSLPPAALAAATPGDARQVDARLAELAGELGELPLALEQVAAYVHQTKTSLADYLRRCATASWSCLPPLGSSAPWPRSGRCRWSGSRPPRARRNCWRFAPTWRPTASPGSCSPCRPRMTGSCWPGCPNRSKAWPATRSWPAGRWARLAPTPW